MAGSLDSFVNVFRNIQPRFSRLYTRILNKTGLTQPQYALLLELGHTGCGPMTMTAISQKLHITKPAVTNLADRLEKNGLLKRVPHESDRRISLLEIQPRGRKIVDCVQGKFVALTLEVVKQFNERDRKIIEKFYTGLSASIDEHLCGKKECRL